MTILIFISAGVWVVSAIKLSITDIKQRILPTRIIWLTLLGVIVLYFVAALVGSSFSSLGWAFVGGAGCYCGFYALYLMNPKLMGGGDVRLSALNGFIVGWFGAIQPWVAVAAAFILAFPVALISLIIRGPRTGLQFGPFMLLGTAVILALELFDLSIF